MNIKGKIKQVIPPNEHDGYFLPDNVMESMHNNKAFITVIRIGVFPIQRTIGNIIHRHFNDKIVTILSEKRIGEEGNIITIDAEPIRIESNGLYRVPQTKKDKTKRHKQEKIREQFYKKSKTMENEYNKIAQQARKEYEETIKLARKEYEKTISKPWNNFQSDLEALRKEHKNKLGKGNL